MTEETTVNLGDFLSDQQQLKAKCDQAEELAAARQSCGADHQLHRAFYPGETDCLGAEEIG